MGGNALAHLGVVRVDSATVVNIYNRIVRTQRVSGEYIPISLVPWVEEKTDHGDIDVVTSSSIKPWLIGVFGVPEERISVNGPVTSAAIEYDGKLVQVDFIQAVNYVSFACFYFSGGDVGSLLGKMAARLGLTFGMEGLRLRANNEFGLTQDIHLTADVKQALAILGCQPPAPDTFRTYQSLWEWVLSSKYAHPAMFLPKATTSENRSRDKNRPKVEQFQAFIQSRYDKDVLDALPPKYTVQQALDILPYKLVEHAHKVISDNREYAAEQQRVTKMFGVDAVQSIFGTGLSDEDVGIIIRQMQGYLPHKDVRYSLARSNAALARQLAAAAAAAAGFPLGFTRVTDS